MGGPHTKRTGVFEKETKEVPGSCFVDVAWKCFSPLRGTNSKTTYYLPSYFSAQYAETYQKNSCLGPLEATHPKAESYTNEGEKRIFLICIRFGSCEVTSVVHFMGAWDSEVKVYIPVTSPINQAGSYPGFCSMKRLGVFLSPLDGMIVHGWVTPLPPSPFFN